MEPRMAAEQANSTVKVIVWDADGVLFNTFDERGRFRWSRTIAEDLAFDAKVFPHIFSAQWTEVLRGTRDTRMHIAEALAAEGSSLSAEEYIDYWLAKDCSVNREVAAHLHPTHSCIGTNQDRLRTDVIANLFGPVVCRVFASSSIGFLKHEEGFYRHVENALELAPEQLCLIDDTLDQVAAARRFGWRAHHFVGTAQLDAFLEEIGFSARGKNEAPGSLL